MICSTDNCTNKARSRGLCSKHYLKSWRKSSLPNIKMKYTTTAASIRFDKFFKKPNDVLCWEWIGAKTKHGYGTFYVEKNKPVLAHRFSYELYKGKIKQGYVICHSCDNPSCVNPNHLWEGTISDNNLDCLKKGRHKSPRLNGEKHGKHKLSEKQVIKIKEMQKEGISQRNIAKNFNISFQHVSKLINAQRWAHLGDKNGSHI